LLLSTAKYPATRVYIMGNRKISADLKMCALSLWDRGWQVDDIVDALLISRASLYRWNAIFEEHGSVNRPHFYLRGRARILTLAVLTAVHTLYESDSDLYLDELVLWLALHHDIIISVSALQENLQTARLTRKLLHKIAIERDDELRQEWKNMLAGDDFLADGSQFIYVSVQESCPCY
jgi:transposase